MTAPPVQGYVAPVDATAADAVAAIAEDLAIFDDWMDRFAHIIDLGRALPPYPEAEMDEAHLVPGCQSRVWVTGRAEAGKLWFSGASDAAIVSGLVALVLRVYSGRPAAEILATDRKFLKDLGLVGALSTNRGNGVESMVRRIQSLAAAASPA